MAIRFRAVRWSAQLPSFLVLVQQFRTPVGISAHPSFSARFGSDLMLTGLATIVHASGLLGGLRGDLISLKVAIRMIVIFQTLAQLCLEVRMIC